MNRQITFRDKTITYDLQIKKVKNINLRINRYGTVFVSASKKVPLAFIDSFVLSKADFILSVIDKYKNMATERNRYFEDAELVEYIMSFCQSIYPYYQRLGIRYPQIRFRKMVSRWGSCNPTKGIVTFNMNLVYAPKECVDYVIYHEFTHFLRADHSAQFYRELEKVCPGWKQKRQKLKNVSIDR